MALSPIVKFPKNVFFGNSPNMGEGVGVPGVLNLLRYFGIYFLLLKTSRNAMKQNINEGRCYFLPFVDVIIPISSI